MDSTDRLLLPAELASRLGRHADSAEIADAMQTVWVEIDISLFPVLGQRGVAALYQRSLFVTASHYPWLAGTFDGIQTTIKLPLLRAALLQQTPTNALVATRFFLQTFEALLTSLVGPSMTDRLLCTVCKNSSGGTAARGTHL